MWELPLVTVGVLHLETPALDEHWPVASGKNPLYSVTIGCQGLKVEMPVLLCGISTELPEMERASLIGTVTHKALTPCLFGFLKLAAWQAQKAG